MRYKIGDVARILGISPDLIRYYEEKGVVSPEKDPHNRYRYYDTWDINYLIDCLWYKNFGFGIDQIAQMVSEYSFDTLYATLEDKSDEILATIRRQELLLQRLYDFRERLDIAKSCVGICDTRRSAAYARYLNRRRFTYDNRTDMQDISREWLKYMPFSRRYFEIPPPGEGGDDDYAWGFSIGVQYVEEFGIAIKPPVELIQPRLCIHSAFKSAGRDQFSARHIDFMTEYASLHGHTVTGPAFGNLSCSVIEDGKPTGYFEVWLPIEEQEA